MPAKTRAMFTMECEVGRQLSNVLSKDNDITVAVPGGDAISEQTSSANCEANAISDQGSSEAVSCSDAISEQRSSTLTDQSTGEITNRSMDLSTRNVVTKDRLPLMEIFTNLPSEMLAEVIQRMTPSALKKAVLVNKLWRELGEEPSLWTWCQVTIYTVEDITNLAIRRLRRIQQIDINLAVSNAEDWEALFLVLAGLPNIKKVAGLDRNTTAHRIVQPSLFASTLAKMEDVSLKGSTYDQIEALFIEMSITSQMKKFHLSGHNLSQLDPGLFAWVLSKLEDLCLVKNDTTNFQMQALFIEMTNKTCLKKLDLYELSLDQVNPILFARALSQVEDVTLRYLRMDNFWGELFTVLSQGTQIRKLDVHGHDLSDVDPGQLARTLAQMEQVNLNRCNLTNNQIQTLFTEMSRETRLKKLNLGDLDLSQLEPGLFARILSRLEELHLIDTKIYSHTQDTIDSFVNQLGPAFQNQVLAALTRPQHHYITPDQMKAFFAESSLNSYLKSLHLSNVDLSSLDPEVFPTTVTRLEEVTLENAHLSVDQALAFFIEISRNGRVKKINLQGDYLKSVDPDVLARALNKVEDVDLSRAIITREQAQALFQEMSQNTQLKKLTTGYHPLYTVEEEVLATAVTKLKEVNLANACPTKDQITSILTHVLEKDKMLQKLELQKPYRAAIKKKIEEREQQQLKLRKSCGAAAFQPNPYLMDGFNPDLVRLVREKLKGNLIGLI